MIETEVYLRRTFKCHSVHDYEDALEEFDPKDGFESPEEFAEMMSETWFDISDIRVESAADGTAIIYEQQPDWLGGKDTRTPIREQYSDVIAAVEELSKLKVV